MYFRLWIIAIAMAFASGCAINAHNSIHKDFRELAREEMPRKMVVLPSDIVVKELGIASTEEVPEWSENGKRYVDQAMLTVLKTSFPNFEIVTLPELPPEQQLLLKEHVALYDLIVTNNMALKPLKAFASEQKDPDDTVGSGLAFLADQIDADALMLVSGEDLVSSDGRVATMVVAAAFGVSIPMGHSALNTGVVDLETGRIIWTNTAFSTTLSLKNAGGAESMVRSSLEDYPAELR